jgi:hypothetical protein
MRKICLIFLAAVIFPQMIRAADNANITQIAPSAFQQLGFSDTTGTDRLPLAVMKKYAREGVARVGWDIGKGAFVKVSLAAYLMGVKIDTALIDVYAVFYDSVSYSRRALKRIPFDSLAKQWYNGAIKPGQHATHFAVMDDSIFVSPLSDTAMPFSVIYRKKFDYLSLDSATTDMPEEYRHLAVLWTCYKASERIGNGRDKDFLEKYLKLRNDILGRGGKD